MSQLKVNSIVPTGGLPAGANGGIIQVVNVVKTDTFTSTASNSFTDITGLSVNITPSSNSHKLLVITGIYGAADASSGSTVRITTAASGSDIKGDSASNRVLTNGAEAGDNNDPSHDVNPIHQNMLLFSPGTTSQVTVKAQFRMEGSGTFFINRSESDTNNSGHVRTVSTITVMEITV